MQHFHTVFLYIRIQKFKKTRNWLDRFLHSLKSSVYIKCGQQFQFPDLYMEINFFDIPAHGKMLEKYYNKSSYLLISGLPLWVQGIRE